MMFNLFIKRSIRSHKEIFILINSSEKFIYIFLLYICLYVYMLFAWIFDYQIYIMWNWSRFVSESSFFVCSRTSTEIYSISPEIDLFWERIYGDVTVSLKGKEQHVLFINSPSACMMYARTFNRWRVPMCFASDIPMFRTSYLRLPFEYCWIMDNVSDFSNYEIERFWQINLYTPRNIEKISSSMFNLFN